LVRALLIKSKFRHPWTRNSFGRLRYIIKILQGAQKLTSYLGKFVL